MHETEVHAYAHILKELDEKKAWEKNQIFTQDEVKKIKEIAKQLGKTKPENIVKISEKQYYVIEAKNKQKFLPKALKEAKEDYANVINKSRLVKAVFISGIAGNVEEGYACKSQYLHNGKWETVTENNFDVTSLLSKNQIERILQNNDPNLKNIEIGEDEFQIAANEINENLQENSIPKDTRAKFMAAILLALADGNDINLDEETILLVKSINSRVSFVLNKHDKPQFCNYASIDEPSSKTNHVKLKAAIVNTVQTLLNLNVRSIMQSGIDIVGHFFEVFLKYGNGAKDLGIVLTPRHITQFAAEVLDIKDSDLVLDPTCGTGGFLVAAFDKVKKESKDERFEHFKKYGLYGIEDKDQVVTLAIVNMIFRGDGKNNIQSGDCFSNWLVAKQQDKKTVAEFISNKKEYRIAPITKVLMNPPFAQKSSKEKEYRFIKHALDQMDNDGLLFSILPFSTMTSKKEKNWRKNDLLKNNTLLSVIAFPSELFYPQAAQNTLGIIIKKGTPHNENQNVLWIRITRDGFRKHKKKRIRHHSEPDELTSITPLLKKFIHNPNIEIKTVAEVQKKSTINYKNKELHLVPEAYLTSKSLTEKQIKNGIEDMVREYIAFNVKFENKLRGIRHG